jgi:hypothetical protein
VLQVRTGGTLPLAVRKATRYTEGYSGSVTQLGCRSTMITKGRPELPVTVPQAVQFRAAGGN